MIGDSVQKLLAKIHGKFQAFTIFLLISHRMFLALKPPLVDFLVNIIAYPITQKLYLWELSYKKAARITGFYKPIKMPIFFVITKRIVTKTSEKEDHIL